MEEAAISDLDILVSYLELRDDLSEEERQLITSLPHEFAPTSVTTTSSPIIPVRMSAVF